MSRRLAMSELLSMLLIGCGAMFFLAGTVGILRLPDVFSRLHALTKADNLGLGFIVLGLSIEAPSWFVVAKLVLIWVLVLASSTTACHLVARTALAQGLEPWEKS
jgi:multicomponent Na+:H+ antiporter subunit G